MHRKPNWSGVFPAVTTQFREDFSLDVAATRRVIDGLIRDGVSGLIVCGTVGENTSLTRAEKCAVMEAAVDAAAGRVPVIAGIAEFTTQFAIETARGGRALPGGRHHADARPGLFVQAARDSRAFPQRGARVRPADDGLQQSADLQERRHAQRPGHAC